MEITTVLFLAIYTFFVVYCFEYLEEKRERKLVNKAHKELTKRASSTHDAVRKEV